MSRPSPRKRLAGFTLVESMVAIVLLGIVLAGINTFVADQSRVELEIASIKQLDRYMSRAETMLNDPHTCAVNMYGRKKSKGYALPLETPETGVMLCNYDDLAVSKTTVGLVTTEIPTIPCSPNLPPVFWAKDTSKTGDFTINSLKISIYTPAPSTASKVNVYQLEVKAKSNTSSRTFTRDIYFRATSDGLPDPSLVDCPDPTKITKDLQKYLCNEEEGHYFDAATKSCQDRNYGGWVIAKYPNDATCPTITRYQKDTDNNIYKWVVPGKATSCNCRLGLVTGTPTPNTANVGISLYNPGAGLSLPVDSSYGNKIDLTRVVLTRKYKNPNSATESPQDSSAGASVAGKITDADLTSLQVDASGATIMNAVPEVKDTYPTACTCGWANDLPDNWATGPIPPNVKPTDWATLAASKPSVCGSDPSPVNCLGLTAAYCNYDNDKLKNYYSTPGAAHANPPTP